MARLIYSGDVNIEHGGLFYALHTWHWDYVNAVRVTPCSDADGPDNCFWVERLTINIRKADDPKRQYALDCIGVSAESFKEMSRTAQRHVLIDAAIAYGHYDNELSEIVRIGKKDAFYDGREGEFNPTVLLRGNVSLARYARAQAHDHCD